MLETKHSHSVPAHREIVLGKLAENRHGNLLTIHRANETSGPLEPVEIAAIWPGTPVRAKFGILDMKGADAIVIQVDERQVVQLLQDKMTGIEQDVGARVIIDGGQKPFERGPVVQILARMQLKHRSTPASSNAVDMASVAAESCAFSDVRTRQKFGR